MQKFSDVIFNHKGRPVPDLRVVVDPYVLNAAPNLSATSSATIYAVDGGPAVQSVKSDADGRFSFYAADGRYNLTVTGAGIAPYMLADVTLNDPGGDPISAVTFGVKSDGSDIAPAMRAAIDAVFAAGGGVIHVPAGRFIVDSMIPLRKGVSIRGAGAATVFVRTANGTVDNVFQGDGALVGSEFSIAAPLALGETEVTFTAAHALTAADYVKIVGQRNGLNAADSGPDWTIGYGTPGSGVCYFGEFNQVKSSTGAQSVSLATGVIFPSYRHDKTQETDVNARSATTFQKVAPIEGVVLADFVIEVQRTINSCIRFNYAADCAVIGVTTRMGMSNAGSIMFARSFNCEAVRCSALHSPRTYTDADKVPNIDFKAANSQRVTFRGCTARNGTQSGDFTYFNNDIVTSFCSFIDNEVWNASDSGMTTHPGSYAITIDANRFVGCRQACAVRSRKSIITNNIGSSNGKLPASASAAIDNRLNYGIGLYEGWARDCIVTGNQMTGFTIGFNVTDAADLGESFDYVGATIHNNVATDCFFGFFRDTNSGKLSTEWSGISFSHNIIKNCFIPIWVESFCVGFKAHHNQIIGVRDTARYAIYLASDTPFADIRFNQFINIGATNVGVRSDSPTPANFSYSVARSNVMRENTFFGAYSAKYTINSTYLKLETVTDSARGEGMLTIADGVTPSAPGTGSACIFVDVADGDLKITFGDGVTKTISLDS